GLVILRRGIATPSRIDLRKENSKTKSLCLRMPSSSLSPPSPRAPCEPGPRRHRSLPSL
ncbi:hypothetical protein HAX54_008796, partial [Datura stramonium]|nr:hypothetical protein [Datura stramonium]